MKQFLFSTGNSWAGLILRISLGLIMLPHGAQKMLGLFGGYGFKTTLAYLVNTMKLPVSISSLVIIIEFFGSLFLIAGLGTKICALLFIAIMIGAIITTNYNNGFFMNWFGNQKGEGFEYHLLVIAICIAILLTGCGKYAVDNLLLNNR